MDTEEIYFIPNMKKVNKYVGLCETAIKLQPKVHHEAVKTTTINHPWSLLEVDLIGPLPKTLREHKYILTTIDIY